MREADAAIAAAPVSDTIKRAGDEAPCCETLARDELWAVQTPQVFRRAALERALDVSPTSCSPRRPTTRGWSSASGGRVLVVDVARENLKVTTPLDLEVAALLLARRSAERSLIPA